MVKYNIADIDALLNDASRFGIGMDEWIRRFASVHESDANYPPHNLVKESSIDFRLELALAGYSKEDIKVETESNKLFVQCTKPGDSEPDHEYLQRGIARRAFTWSRTIADDVEVKGAELKDGLLKISMERIIPEGKKPRSIEIK